MPRSSSEHTPPRAEFATSDVKSLLALLVSSGIALVCLVGLWVGDRRFILSDGHSVISPMSGLLLLTLGGELLLLRWGPRGRFVRTQALWVCGLTGCLVAYQLTLRLSTGVELLPWDHWLLPEIAGARGMQATPLSVASSFSFLAILLSLGRLLAGPRSHPGLLRLSQAANIAAIALSLFHLFCPLMGISPHVLGVLWTGAAPVHCALLFLSLAIASTNHLWSTIRVLILGKEQYAGETPSQEEITRQNRILAGLLVICIGTLLVLALTMRTSYRRSTQEIDHDLRAVAKLKASEVETWLNERIMDARWHAANPSTKIIAEGETAAPDILAESRQAGEYFRETYGYAAVIVCGEKGEILLSTPPDHPTESLVNEELLTRARNGRQPRLLDFYTVRGQSYLASTAPLARLGGQRAKGFVLLIIDPRKTLIPMMAHWPSGEATGRCFLVEVEGQDLVHLLPQSGKAFVKEGHGASPSSGLLCQASTILSPNPLLMEGRDDEGLQRLGVAVPVKGTPWHLVASVSSDSAYAELREKLLQQLLNFLLLLALIAGGTSTLWRLRHERSRAKEFEARQAKDAMAKRVGVLMQRVNDSILLFDQDMRIIEANDRAVRMYGYDLRELIGMSAKELRGPEGKAAVDLDFHAARAGQGVIFSTTHRRKDGSIVPVEVSSCPVELEGRHLVISTIRDNSERQAQLREIEDLNRFFLVISRINQAILRQRTRRELFATICNILVETGQFKIAWVGLFDPGTRLLSPIAVSGDEYGYVRAIHVSTDPSVPEGLGPSGTALREQQPVVCNDFMSTPATGPWKEEAERSGIRSSIALPLRQEGRIVGMLNVYAREVNFFTRQKVKLLEKAANDIAFAMDLLASNERRQLTEAALVASERRLTFLLSSTPAVIYSLKAGGSFATTFISSNVQTILGHAPENFVQLPAFWNEHVHPDDLQAAMDSLGAAKPGEPVVRTYRFRHKDGSYRWMHDEMRGVLDDYGMPAEYVGYWADITESMRSAEELRNSRDRLAKAEQMASLGNWEFDHLAGHLSWSEELYRIFEMSQSSADASREAMLSRVHPEDRNKAREVFQGCVLRGERFSTSFRLLLPDGRIKYLEESGESFRDTSGRLLRSVGAIQDLTSRKQVEIELHELVKQLRVLHLVAIALDAPDKALEEIIRLVADNLPRAMRNPEATRVTVSVEGCTHSSGPDAARVEKYRAPVSINGREAGSLIVFQESKPGDTHSPLLTQEQETVESVAKSLGMGLGGRESLAAIRKFNLELERKVQERTAELALKNREIQGLLNAIPDLVLRIRSDGCILDVQQAHDSSALLALAAAKGSKTEMNADNPLIPVCLDAGREALRNEKTVTRERLIPLPSGSVAIEFRAAPIDAEEFVVFVRDITTRKQIEQEMEAMLEKERQVSELKSRFISVTSHEFRTPMAATMGAVEILRNHADKLSPSKREELYGRITVSLHRMTSMLDDILTLSRLGASHIRVQSSRLNLEQMVNGIVEEVRLGDQESHEWRILRTGDDPECESDAHLLTNILTNLLSNACHYSPRGTTITVDLRLDPEQLCLAVEDQGIGVPEKDWQRIFEPFERGSNVGTIKGTGLGLNIVQGMTELLGGTVRIEHSSSSGSRFAVTLPRHRSTESQESDSSAGAD